MKPAQIFATIAILAANAAFAQAPAAPVLIDPNNPSGSNQCSDGIDNDGDGKVDFNASLTAGDDGCWDPSDNDERAGVPAGTTLSKTGNCSSGTLAGNTTYTACDFATGVTLNGPNITIRNSHIGSNILTNSDSYANTLLIEDTDIIGPENTSAYTLDGTYIMRRLRVRLFPQCFYTTAGTVEDSVCYDGWAQSSDCHMEPLLSHGTGVFAIRRTRLVAIMHPSEQCTAGAYTGVAVIHADSGFWGPAKNKTIEYNRFEGHDDVGYCFYGGSASPSTSDIHMEHNVWATDCGSFGPCTSWDPNRSGSTFVGNVRGATLATGTALSKTCQ